MRYVHAGSFEDLQRELDKLVFTDSYASNDLEAPVAHRARSPASQLRARGGTVLFPERHSSNSRLRR
jgi:hypothetical protein